MKFRSGTKAALSTSSTARAQNQKGLGNEIGSIFPFHFSRTDKNVISKKPITTGNDKIKKHNMKKTNRFVPVKSNSNVILSSFDSARRDFLLYKDNMIAAEDNYERFGVTVDALLRNRVALAITTIGLIGAVTKLLPPNPQK